MSNAIHYLATLTDGTIPASTATAPVTLTGSTGTVIDHPTPCARRWYDETAFSYFRLVTAPGEALENHWDLPIRLWTVEPVGETGTPDPRHYPYVVLTHQIRVTQEIDPATALGPNGQRLQAFLRDELAARAVQWAADWTADPIGMERQATDLRLANTQHRTSGLRAEQLCANVAGRARLGAARATARAVAARRARRAAQCNGADPKAASYAVGRAVAQADALLLEHRMSDYVLRALNGTDLDSTTLAGA
ncbi:hypothetical protein ABT224_20330 [Streptomyces sp. NPDC001584]|uniref:hypothetical protein n=1 Tax=Streptomyces sp. NPDC001584 TaxID=3154521 RepID=UPI00332D4A3E